MVNFRDLKEGKVKLVFGDPEQIKAIKEEEAINKLQEEEECHCKTCEGKGSIECNECNGEGYVTCDDCGGEGTDQ